MSRRIHLKGDRRTEENIAAEAISPGHLIKRDTSGTLIKHDDVDGPAEAYFAREDAEQGKTIDDAYATDDRVFCILPAKGTEIQAILQGGVTCPDGNALSSGGDGTLILATGTDYVVAFATKALDLNALPADFISVRVV